MDSVSVIQNEVSQKEKSKYCIFVESRRVVQMNYSQGRNRAADTEDRQAGGGEGRGREPGEQHCPVHKAQV